MHCAGPAWLCKDEGLRLTFFDFPAEHWAHLRTTDVVESPIAKLRLRQRVTKPRGGLPPELHTA
jgi:transposase-like protein